MMGNPPGPRKAPTRRQGVLLLRFFHFTSLFSCQVSLVRHEPHHNSVSSTVSAFASEPGKFLHPLRALPSIAGALRTYRSLLYAIPVPPKPLVVLDPMSLVSWLQYACIASGGKDPNRRQTDTRLFPVVTRLHRPSVWILAPGHPEGVPVGILDRYCLVVFQ